jgi:hypothetical protein
MLIIIIERVVSMMDLNTYTIIYYYYPASQSIFPSKSVLIIIQFIKKRVMIMFF